MSSASFPVVSGTPLSDIGLVRSADATSSSFADPVPTITEPSGDGVINVVSNVANNSIMLFPYGTDAASETFKLRLWGWEKIGSLWRPHFILEASCVLGSSPAGVAGQPISNTRLSAHQISIASGINSFPLSSPGGNLPAWLTADIYGARKVEVRFSVVSAASCNAAYRLF